MKVHTPEAFSADLNFKAFTQLFFADLDTWLDVVPPLGMAAAQRAGGGAVRRQASFEGRINDGNENECAGW